MATKESQVYGHSGNGGSSTQNPSTHSGHEQRDESQEVDSPHLGEEQDCRRMTPGEEARYWRERFYKQEEALKEVQAQKDRLWWRDRFWQQESILRDAKAEKDRLARSNQAIGPYQSSPPRGSRAGVLDAASLAGVTPDVQRFWPRFESITLNCQSISDLPAAIQRMPVELWIDTFEHALEDEDIYIMPLDGSNPRPTLSAIRSVSTQFYEAARRVLPNGPSPRAIWNFSSVTTLELLPSLSAFMKLTVAIPLRIRRVKLSLHQYFGHNLLEQAGSAFESWSMFDSVDELELYRVRGWRLSSIVSLVEERFPTFFILSISTTSLLDLDDTVDLSLELRRDRERSLRDI